MGDKKPSNAASINLGPDPKTITLYYDDGRDHKSIKYQDIVALIPVSGDERDTTRDYILSYLVSSESEANSSEHHVKACHEHVRPPMSILDEFIISDLPRHLSFPVTSNGSPNIHVVVSTKSGSYRADPFFLDVVQPVFDIIGLSRESYQVHRTTSEHSVKEFASEILFPNANEGIKQTVLLLSGDGGIVDVINAIVSYPRHPGFVKPVVGLIAKGTGNALANSSGLNRDSTKGLRSFLRGSPRPLPTFSARFSPGSKLLTNEGRDTQCLHSDDHGRSGLLHGAVVCSWGLHACLVADSDTTEYRKYGTKRFQMASQELLYPADGSEPHRYRGQVTLFRINAAGREYPEYLDRMEHMYILATFVSNLEEQFRISPRSKPLDGQLRLLHFGTLSGSEIMRILTMAFGDGGHVKEEAVGYQEIEGLRIELSESDSRWRRICVDGKIVQVEEGGWVEVRKESHDVLDLVVELE